MEKLIMWAIIASMLPMWFMALARMDSKLFFKIVIKVSTFSYLILATIIALKYFHVI